MQTCWFIGLRIRLSDNLHFGGEGCHEVSRWQGAGERRSLAGPLGAKARLADGLASGVEGLASIIGNRVGWDLMSGNGSAEVQ